MKKRGAELKAEAARMLAAEEERRIEAEKEQHRQAKGRKKPANRRRRHRRTLTRISHITECFCEVPWYFSDGKGWAWGMVAPDAL